jgi:hypothetical protein
MTLDGEESLFFFGYNSIPFANKPPFIVSCCLNTMYGNALCSTDDFSICARLDGKVIFDQEQTYKPEFCVFSLRKEAKRWLQKELLYKSCTLVTFF